MRFRVMNKSPIIAGNKVLAGNEPAENRLSVYIHLDHGRSPETWADAYKKGKVFEEAPYGYHWAQPWVTIGYSLDGKESKIIRVARRGLKHILGFDLIHAFRNRRCADSADVIWTHTEAEYLADALLMKIGLMKRAPLIGQSVWLWDKWLRWSALRKRLHLWLLQEVTISTSHSQLNANVGSTILKREVLVVPFGIEPVFQAAAVEKNSGDGIRVVAPGNDRHRDWKTLYKVARENRGIEVVVLSSRRNAHRLVDKNVPNFIVRSASGVTDLIEEYSRADVVVVPLQPNLHASGITVAMEGINAGRPVVITKTGGVEDYFKITVDYVEPGDVAGLAAAIRSAAKLTKDIGLMDERRDWLPSSGLLIKDYGRRHILLSRLALGLASKQEKAAVSQYSPVTIS